MLYQEEVLTWPLFCMMKCLFILWLTNFKLQNNWILPTVQHQLVALKMTSFLVMKASCYEGVTAPAHGTSGGIKTLHFCLKPWMGSFVILARSAVLSNCNSAFAVPSLSACLFVRNLPQYSHSWILTPTVAGKLKFSLSCCYEQISDDGYWIAVSHTDGSQNHWHS